jgi:hypothetical protein
MRFRILPAISFDLPDKNIIISSIIAEYDSGALLPSSQHPGQRPIK